jgi:hypothetical protein
MSNRDKRAGISAPLLAAHEFDDDQEDDSLPLINEQDISAIIRQAGAANDGYRKDARGVGGSTRETKLAAGNSMMKSLQKSLNKSIVIAPDATELAHDKVLPPGRAVDFQKHMDDLKARTETEIPFTTTQVEDAMYLDKTLVVTLEYHYYQNG